MFNGHWCYSCFNLCICNLSHSQIRPAESHENPSSGVVPAAAALVYGAADVDRQGPGIENIADNAVAISHVSARAIAVIRAGTAAIEEAVPMPFVSRPIIIIAGGGMNIEIFFGNYLRYLVHGFIRKDISRPGFVLPGKIILAVVGIVPRSYRLADGSIGIIHPGRFGVRRRGAEG